MLQAAARAVAAARQLPARSLPQQGSAIVHLTALHACRRGRAGGRNGDSRWELTPSAAGLRELTVKMHQQYETPQAVMELVLRKWRPTFDAMATPLSALCARYATLEDDILRHDAVPRDSVVYVNPAYADPDALNGAGGLEQFLGKLIDVDVGQRGCTLVALLPNHHAPWHRRFVGASHECHFVLGQLVFQNPWKNPHRMEKKGYLWANRSYILVVWRPGAPPAQPAWLYADLGEQPCPAEERIRLRHCAACGCVRMLPRWAPAPPPARKWRCQDNPDVVYASCSVPEFVPICVS